MKPFYAALAGLSAFVLISCILGGDKVAGRGSEVENELGVYGRLVDENGKAVAGARVIALPAPGSSAAADTDTTRTDGKGRYGFDSLPSGEYNVLGEAKSGSLVVLIPDVDVAGGDKPQDLGTDTLRAPGRIRGRLLAGTRGKPGIMAFVPTLSLFDVSDDSGRFEIAGLPGGAYTIRYNAVGLVIAPDSGIPVHSGEITFLPDKQIEYDPSLAPPEPYGLKAVYDTLNERVRLSWVAVPVSDLDGFVIYRENQDFLTPEIVEVGFSKAAEFTDKALGDLSSGVKEYVYRVKSRDKGFNLSLVYSEPASVLAVPHSRVATTSSVEVLGARPGFASPGDSVRLVLRFENPGRGITEIEWFLDGAAEPIRRISFYGGVGSDTLPWIAGMPGTHHFTVRMTDQAGDSWTASSSVDVLLDAPQAKAGADRQVSLGDSVFLHGEGADQLGRIEAYAWSIDGQPFRSSPDGRFAFSAPGSPGIIPCILRVNDDDGNAAFDTLMLSVLEDPPVVSGGLDTTVSLGDLVRLHPTALDGFGRILSWEWSVGSIGTFRRTANGDTAFHAPTGAGRILCILKVTDDDGVSASDTVDVYVLADPPTAEAGQDTSVSLGDSLRLAGTARDRFGTIEKTEWKCGEEQFVVSPLRTGRKAPAAADPAYLCILRVTDDDGQSSLDTLRVDVGRDPPIAVAGKDTVLSIKDSLLVHGNGHDRFGSIVKWEWKAGSAPDFADLGRDPKFKLPDTSAAVWPIVLRVTDDDGQSGLDTLLVQVLKDEPFADIVASGSTKVFSGDSATFSAAGSRDGMGRIVKWEWKSGAGSFVDSPGPSFAMVMNAPEQQKYPCLVRVTDDDGNQAVDTQFVDILPTGGSRWLQAGEVFDSRGYTRHSAVSFKGKLWLFVSVGSHPAMSNAIWNSDDGLEWKRVTASSPYPPRFEEAVVVFKDRIWVIGGVNPVGTERLSDAWSSEDGVNWSRVTDALPFPFMEMARGCVFKDRIWVIGGFRGGNVSSLGYVWNSTDGVNWNSAQGSVPQPAYLRNSMHASNGELFLLGADYELYHSPDGTNWTKQAWSPSFPELMFPRTGETALGPIVVGYGISGGKTQVWRVTPASRPQFVTDTPEFGQTNMPAPMISHKGRVWLFAEQDSKIKIWYSK